MYSLWIRFPHRPLTLIPSYPDLPMEKVYPRTPTTDVAEVCLRPLGAGCVVDLPCDIGRVFWEILAVDHGALLRNAVQWASDEKLPVELQGPGVLDVTVWRQEGSMTVSLVNLTNPMMMKGPFRELIPIGEQRVTIRLSMGEKACRVQLLVAGRETPVTQVGSHLSVTVPSIRDLEIVAVDL